jgi:hypothetical protein
MVGNRGGVIQGDRLSGAKLKSSSSAIETVPLVASAPLGDFQYDGPRSTRRC